MLTKRRNLKRKPLVRNQLGNYVKKIVTSLDEKKAANAVILATTNVQATWTFTSIIAGCAIIQGLTKSTRVGERIRLTKIELVLSIVPSATAASMADGSCCRLIIYHNKQANGSVPTGAQMFNNDQEHGTRNITFANRLSILKDITHSMVVTGQAAGVPQTAGPKLLTTMNFYPKTKITFGGAGGAIGDILKDDYGIGFCTDNNNCCIVTCHAQVHYTDD